MTSDWEPFFSSLAQVAATAFAVLLATLQVTRRTWRSSTLRAAAGALALLELLVPLLAGVVALMPGNPWRVGYLLMGSVGLLGLVWHGWLYLRHEDEADTFDQRQIRIGLPVSLGVYFGLVAFAWNGSPTSLYVVGGLSAWLLLSGSGGAWLLLDVGRGRGADDAHGAATRSGETPAVR
ncbi:hypothetical protein [Geodermatophilus sp. SYSU D01176]